MRCSGFGVADGGAHMGEVSLSETCNNRAMASVEPREGVPSDDIRQAGTIIPARPGPRGVEVLVLRRSGRHRFLPGYVVFPGGAVDAADADLAQRWFGDRGQAARACAVRELVEEAGLLSTAGGLVAAGGPEAVPQGASDFPIGPPRGAQLPEVSHWIAPEDVPVRFDARFFAVASARGIAPVPDGREVVHAWWARPADLLEANNSGGCLLYWPTMKVVEGLAACASVEELLAVRIPQVEAEVQII
jgi:recombination protein RecT